MIVASTCALDTESGAFVAGISESWESLLAEWLREPSNTAGHEQLDAMKLDSIICY